MSKSLMKITVPDKPENLSSNKPDIGQLWFYPNGGEIYLIVGKSKKYDDHFNCLVWSDEEDKFVDDNTQATRDFENYYRRIYLKNSETPEDAVRSLKKEMLEYLLDPSLIEQEENEDELSDDTSLVPVKGKNEYENIRLEIERNKSRAGAIIALAKKRIEKIESYAHALAKKLGKVMRVIGMLEVYLGIHEEIFQITEGMPASQDEPICIRQLILYMDEEAGLVRFKHDPKGMISSPLINFANIEEFDNWLLDKKNLNLIIPEKKGIVALRPSRQTKYYENDDAWSRAQKERADSMLYLLIRNGENLYRIWTDLIGTPVFFPTKADSESIAELFESGSSWDYDKAQDRQAIWLTNTLLIQGLIDRTEVFYPISKRIVLTDPMVYGEEGLIKLIRDAENVISDGRPSFNEWLEELNKTTDRGSRVFFTGLPYDRNNYPNRFVVYQNWYPAIPELGVYTIEEIVKDFGWSKTDAYRILYLPSDQKWSVPWDVDWNDFSWERKKRYSFILKDDEFINYDNFTIEDIEYYLASRSERRHYIEIVNILTQLRAIRIKELKEEKDFATLLSQKENIPLDKIMELIEWWKKKVINNRPLNSDDAKAWRMIVKKSKKIG